MSGKSPLVDHDDFELNQSKIMYVIDPKSLERDAGGIPVSTFPHPALVPNSATDSSGWRFQRTARRPTERTQSCSR